MSEQIDIQNEAAAPEASASEQRVEQPKNKNRLLSDSPEKTLKALMEIMAELKPIYEQEQNAAKSLDMETFMKLQENKQVLAHQYDQSVFALGALKKPIKNLDEEMIEMLQETHAEFTKLSEENLNVLLSMKLATGKLRHRILDMAKRHLIKEQNAGYSSNGESNSAEKRKISSALNETA